MARKEKTTGTTKAASVRKKPVQDLAIGSTAFDDLADGGISSTHDEIAKTAYHFWEQRGRIEGAAEEDWFRARTASGAGNP